MPSKVETWFQVSPVYSGLTWAFCVPGSEQPSGYSLRPCWCRAACPLGSLEGVTLSRDTRGGAGSHSCPCHPLEMCNDVASELAASGGPAENQCLPRGFPSAWGCACSVTQVSINLDVQNPNSFQTRTDGWEIYAREILSLFTVRKEFQSK